ncbi:hypothetical protein EVAR_69463_1 [Eumeta japonica]|uniref:Uncharacterized protein n=1 Tax=Eumeta variegata TaxID=151549 RepID=A0A4C1SEE3_EUMVA|nr:hypothetical protein EVAR_69463_1 [Eumeta japonica]
MVKGCDGELYSRNKDFSIGRKVSFDRSRARVLSLFTALATSLRAASITVRKSQAGPRRRWARERRGLLDQRCTHRESVPLFPARGVSSPSTARYTTAAFCYDPQQFYCHIGHLVIDKY